MRKFKILGVGTALVFALALVVPSTTANAVGTKTVSVNVNATIEPTLTLSSSTNSVAFGNLTPMTKENVKENAITLTIQSNNAYSVKVKATDFKRGDSKPTNFALSNLKIKKNVDSAWMDLTTKDQEIFTSSTSTASTKVPLDVRLDVPWVDAEPATYSSTLSFTASQI